MLLPSPGQTGAPIPAAEEPAARFHLAGRECVVVPACAAAAKAAGGAASGLVGFLSLGGHRFVVLSLAAGLPSEPDPLELLSSRELEIALLIAAGHEAKAIARRLRISFHTVRVHTGRIYAKLGLHKQTELAARVAARFGAAA